MAISSSLVFLMELLFFLIDFPDLLCYENVNL